MSVRRSQRRGNFRRDRRDDPVRNLREERLAGKNHRCFPLAGEVRMLLNARNCDFPSFS